ncbi:Hypothetical predicted protein [Octopus vulgaris]|uniref:Splicing factor YJU2 n=1 Tax=Octopus vulgaris TaxID=6645 RepID=A0AA36EYT3_OCTVU|nr:Hypothetical predicted protein [Octopus vulgaris]
MSERKVLNKYYPPDFDPSKIPKLRLPRNRQYSIRIMAPFNMRCNTCGEYVYKGKKFNSRKETVENEDYLGLKIFRFYIKCPRCVSEIAFKTDLKNTDYTLEAGATRNFEAAKLAEQMEERSRKEKEEEEMNNPMKVLENRTKASRQEMEQIDALEELRDLNNRHATVDHETMLKLHAAYEEQLAKLQDEEDENLVKSIFNNRNSDYIKRLEDEDEDEGEVPNVEPSSSNKAHFGELLTEHIKDDAVVQKKRVWNQSVGLLSSKSLSSLVKKKKGSETVTDESSETCEKNSTDTKCKTETNAKSKSCDKTDEPTNDNSTKTSKVQKNGTAPVSSALSLLGNYSDSDSDS